MDDRERAVRTAIASLRLSGHEPSNAERLLLNVFAAGGMSLRELGVSFRGLGTGVRVSYQFSGGAWVASDPFGNRGHADSWVAAGAAVAAEWRRTEVVLPETFRRFVEGTSPEDLLAWVRGSAGHCVDDASFVRALSELESDMSSWDRMMSVDGIQIARNLSELPLPTLATDTPSSEILDELRGDH